MVGYLDTALALMQMSVKPDTTAGLNMCNNGTSYTSTRFPWSQLALPSATSSASTTLSLCTKSSPEARAIVAVEANSWALRLSRVAYIPSFWVSIGTAMLTMMPSTDTNISISKRLKPERLAFEDVWRAFMAVEVI
jgi:hypothetical protein